MSFSNPILSGNTLIRNAIESENFVTGVSGWQIARDGTAEFSNVIVRGEVEVGGTPYPKFILGLRDNAISGGVETSGLFVDMEVAEQGDLGGLIATYGVPFPSGGASIFLFPPSWDPPPNDVPYMQLSNEAYPTPGIFFSNQGGGAEGSWSFLIDDVYGVDIQGTFESANMRHQVLSTSTDISGLVSTSFTESDTELRFTLPAPPSGIITVSFGFMGLNNTAGQETRMAFEVRQDNISGTILNAASTLRRASTWRQSNDPAFSVIPITGLTGTIFIRFLYSVSGGTGTISDRHVSIVPSP